MFEKTLTDLGEDWPEAEVTIRMYNSIDVVDVGGAMNPKATGIPFTGADLDKFFRKAVVSMSNVPLLNGEKLSGTLENGGDRVGYITPMFMFEVVLAAMSYSQMSEADVKNS